MVQANPQPDAPTGKTWADVVREVYPDADDDLVEFLLWEKTAYPMGGASNVRELLTTLKATQDAGLTPCDDCNKPALKRTKGIFDLCADCAKHY